MRIVEPQLSSSLMENHCKQRLQNDFSCKPRETSLASTYGKRCLYSSFMISQRIWPPTLEECSLGRSAQNPSPLDPISCNVVVQFPSQPAKSLRCLEGYRKYGVLYSQDQGLSNLATQHTVQLQGNNF